MRHKVRKDGYSLALQRTITAGLITLSLLITGCASLFVDREADQKKAVLLLKLATEQMTQKKYSEALESCRKAIDLAPNYPTAYNHLALVYMESKRYEKSEEAFRKALELNPDFAEAHNNLGVLMNRRERYREAIQHFEKALSYDSYVTPENALTNMGYSWYRLGNAPKAKQFHQKALDVAPLFCLATKNMGDVYAKEKDYKRAADYFEKAATNCPLYPESQYKLGLTMMKMGHRSIAKNHFQKLVEKHKSGPYVERSTEVLKYLQ